MGLCFSHSSLEGTYDEVTKLCQSRLLATPVTLTNLLSAAKREQIGPRRVFDPSLLPNGTKRRNTMAALFPSMNYLKTIVSKNRNRHKEHGFDLDLTYITDRIIAMAYPAERVQSIFRNHLNDVHDFLELKHKDHYYIYNLCSEKSYDKAKFCNRVKVYPFNDHNPPSFVIIKTFCEDVSEWLQSDPQNVIAIHCKAGKGRTGTMICCYLLHCGMYDDPDDAIQFYGKMRTQDGQGVTIPSQIRYVKYYAQYLKEQLTYTPKRIYIKRIELKPAPKFSDKVLFTVRQKKNLEEVEEESKDPKPYVREPRPDARRVGDFGECKTIEDDHSGKHPEMGIGFKSRNFSFRSRDPIVVMDDKIIKTLSGDVRIELFYRSPVLTKKKRFARIWINTFFADLNGTVVENHKKVLVFKKQELDIAGKKDKNNRLLMENFEITVHIKVPSTDEEIQAALEDSRKKDRREEEEESSGTEDDTDDENDWESGKSQSASRRADEGSGANKGKPQVINPARLGETVRPGSSSTSVRSSKIPEGSPMVSRPLVATTCLTEGTSPSVTSSSSEATPNTSVMTAINLKKGAKLSQSTDSSSSIETNLNLPSPEVVPSQTVSDASSVTRDESRTDFSDDLEASLIPHGSSNPGTLSTKAKVPKSDKGFFKSLSKKFSSKK